MTQDSLWRLSIYSMFKKQGLITFIRISQIQKFG